MGEPERLRRPHDESECCDAQGLLRCTDKGDVAVAAEQVDIGVNVGAFRWISLTA